MAAPALRSDALVDARPARPLVVLVGNPNTGKTTLFNRLTGQRARVGNYPGVTVERRHGLMRLGATQAADEAVAEVVDVPGAYSLAARSAEEQIALNAVLGFGGNVRPDLAVVVVDAGQLLRNLYLVLQLAELEVPVVVALNMMDEVEHNPPSPVGVARLFNVPVVPVSARRGEGIEQLRETIGAALAQPPRPHAAVVYPDEVLQDAEEVAVVLPSAWRLDAARDRALALWALTSVEEHDELHGIDPSLRQVCLRVQEREPARDLDGEVIAARYAFLDRHADSLHQKIDEHPRKHPLSERLDRVLLHPLLGMPIFLLLMLVVFQALFSWANPAIGLVEDATAWLQTQLIATLPAGTFTDLLTQGIIGGVGNVLVFLPQIVLLFFFIGVLEDSGYMARVAFLMDRLMRALGLHGRAFVPMMSGFACAVPAILATRTMERYRDRVLTMMVVPLMTCSARLPVYTLIIAALFPPAYAFGLLPVQGLLMVAMYVFSILTALTAAGVLGRTVLRGIRVPLILELPPYRIPTASSLARMVASQAWTFVREAGTVILACTVVLWVLLSFPRLPDNPATRSLVPSAHRTLALEQSYGGRLGHALEPLLRPLGFDWKIGVGIIGAFAAREVFVSTLGVIYGVGDADENALPLRDHLRAERRADGTRAYTPLVGLSLMVFFALACQCMSTLAVTRRETHGWRWPAFMFAYMTTLAWVASFAVYQGGQLLGL
jgi:ferrous iron transport protein B